MKFHYYDKTVRKFAKKHPRNFNQLYHMVWASHTSFTNLAITSFLYNQDSFLNVLEQYRLNAIDIGTSVDAALRYCKKKYKLPEKYHDEAEALLKALEGKDKNIADKIKEIIDERGLTWGVYITLLIQEHITLALEIAVALSEGKGIDRYMALLTTNGVQLINAYQNAGNNPILIEKGVKIWNTHNEQFVKQVRAHIDKDYKKATKLYGALQLHSFPMANFFIKAIL